MCMWRGDHAGCASNVFSEPIFQIQGFSEFERLVRIFKNVLLEIRWRAETAKSVKGICKFWCGCWIYARNEFCNSSPLDYFASRNVSGSEIQYFQILWYNDLFAFEEYFENYKETYEERTFWMLVHLLHEKNWRIIFKYGTPKLLEMMKYFEKEMSIQAPEIYERISETNVYTSHDLYHILILCQLSSQSAFSSARCLSRYFWWTRL